MSGATIPQAKAQELAGISSADLAPFSQLRSLQGAGVERIAVDPHDGSRIYVDARGGRIARTVSGGLDWEVIQAASPSEYFRAIAVDPADSSIVLAFSAADFGGPPGAVYESQDAGAHWHRLPNQPVGELGPAGLGRGIVVDRRGKVIVLSDRQQGIFRSADFGRTWTNPLPASQAHIYPLAADPNDPATLWAGGFDLTNNFAAAIWVSHDFGRTWTKSIPNLDPASSFLPLAIGVQPGTGKVLVAVDGIDPVTGAGIVRVIASQDGGKTWTDSSGGLGALKLGVGVGNSIVFDPSSADIVYASLNGDLGLLRSTDGGASWVQMIPRQFDSFFTLAVTPSSAKDSARILAGGSYTFYTSSDHGATWTPREEGLEAQTARSVVDDGWRSGGIYAISTAGGLAHSWNGGQQWRQIDPDPGIREAQVMTVDRVSLIHPTYVMTTTPGTRKLWRSIDLGHRWSPLDASPLDVPPSFSDLMNLVADPLRAGRLYVLLSTASLSNGLLRSDDYGEHWSTFTIGADGDAPVPFNFGLDSSLIPDPARAATLYVAMFSGLWKSTDAGTSWNFLAQLPLGFFGIIGVAVTDGPAGGVYVETDAPDGNFVLEKSTDGGTTWSIVSSTFGGEPFALREGPEGRLFAYSTFFFSPCFEPHVQQSTDGAVTWSELPDTGVFATFGFSQCPNVTPTASHIYVGDLVGSHLTFGVRYPDLTAHGTIGAAAARQLSPVPNSASRRTVWTRGTNRNLQRAAQVP